MKTLLFICVFLFVTSARAFSQCPEKGLDIQSNACETPSALTTEVSNSAIKMKWQGMPGQSYVLHVSEFEVATSQIVERKITNYSCDNNGACLAYIAVQKGSEFSWNVQASCAENAATINSFPSLTEKVNIAVTNELLASIATLKVFPNPTNRDLLIEYTGPVTARTIFTIMDVSGRIASRISASAVSRVNSLYRLVLPNLASGTYILNILNEKTTSQAKFLIMTN